MSRGSSQRSRKSAQETWQEFIQAEQKKGSKIGKAFDKAQFGGFEDKIVTLYFADENLCKTAKGQIEPLRKKLPRELLPCDRVNFQIGKVSEAAQSPVNKTSRAHSTGSQNKINNPLQALNFTDFGRDRDNKELSQPILEAAAKAESNCSPIYEKLKQRTEALAQDGAVVPVSFNWRLRVGGMRGFRELLLPVFHPVFGIPYIPASSLKGAARAWAIHNGDAHNAQRLLGVLQGKSALAAKVEFLDAFPMKPCLSVDIATPQWHWQGNRVVYKPEPHPLLSMEQPNLLIGFRPTAKGKPADVQIVKEWLENSLQVGIGSRVSSGYGRALGQATTLPCSRSFDFELWTQGMYGSQQPTKQNSWQGSPEFRPTAIRGILRFWYRAVALGLYDSSVCQELEDNLFGALSRPGELSLNVRFNEIRSKDPYLYSGKIDIEASDSKHLDLLSNLLILSAHLGGAGRGSRRPLHLLNGRMRGCHWSLDDTNLPLKYDLNQWKQFLKNLTDKFKAVNPSTRLHSVTPTILTQRQQDVLDKNAQIWLLKCSEQVPPDHVRHWKAEGDNFKVRGKALNLLYSSDRYKGENQQGRGNQNVGGAFGIPSYVWIKSIFPANSTPYQVVSIFGVDHPERKAFAKELQNLGAELVFGQISSR